MLDRLAVGGGALAAQWLPEAQLRALQARRLRRTIQHAHRASPFYQQLWRAAGVDPASVRSAADLRRLPIVGKADMRKRLDEIIAPGYNETTAAVSHTSGSTGETLRLLHDHRNNRYLNAAWIRAHMAYGFKPHHRMAYFKNLPAIAGVATQLGIFRSTHLPFDAPPETSWQRLREIRPHVLGGYPSHLAQLIQWFSPTELRSLGVRWIFAGAETMPANTKHQLLDIFGCPVIDLYGTTEFGNVAFECRHGGRHVNDDTVAVEVVVGGEPAGPGVVGDLVITGLRNDAMPLIRYRIGDLGSWSDEKCRCGRSLTLLPVLEGRSTEAIVAPDGRRYTFTVLCEYVRLIDSLYQFQIVQDAADAVTLNLVCAPGTEQETIRLAVEGLRKALGASMGVTARVVDYIPRTAGGKLKPVLTSLSLA